LVLISLATPLFLLAAWRIDQYQLGGDWPSTSYLQQTTLLVGLGFALWLAVVPFHNWLTTTAAEASPPAAAFVLITFPIVAFSILMRTLADWPWLLESSPLAWVMVLAGVLTAFVGGVLASVQRGFSLLLGYAALYDLGCTLAVLGVGGEAAVITVLVSLTVRAVALTLIAACLSAIRLQTAYDGFAEIAGLARRLPAATAGLLIGGLTLAGVPLTVGFPLRWQLLQSIAGIDSRWPLLLTLAGLGVAVGYLRGFRALLLSPTAPNKKERPPTGVALAIQEPLLLLIIIALLATACIVFGLFPSLLIEPLQRLSVGIEIPIW
jgi:multicomponent Na+:H+ antiporter subunit D